MSTAFVSDIEHILLNMNRWIQCSILNEQSQMRLIVKSTSANGSAEDQLYHLTKLKMTLFDQFSLAIRKLLCFFQIAKVSSV